MTLQDDGKYLTINLFCFTRLSEARESYFFSEMSTLQATTLLPQARKIIAVKIVAYTPDNKYLEPPTLNFKTIGEFNAFFTSNPTYYIANLEMELENDLVLYSHDDGEVTIELVNNFDQSFIDWIFEKYKLRKELINTLKSKPGHYLSIDQNSNITGIFETFDDYLGNNQNH